MQAYYKEQLAVCRATEAILREEASLLSDQVRAGGLTSQSCRHKHPENRGAAGVHSSECSGSLQCKAGLRDNIC